MSPKSLKTPEEWSNELNILIMDADGWRGSISNYNLEPKDFNSKISLNEFNIRCSYSTILPLSKNN